MVAAFVFGSVVLAGCSSNATGTITHTPAIKTTGGRDTARSGTQIAILVADTTNGIALPGGPTPASIARQVFAMMHGPRATVAAGARRTSATGTATGPCTNSMKQSQATNANGGAVTTTDFFYDPACTTLETEEIITVDSPGAAATTGSGTITTYGTTGNLRVIAVLGINVSSAAGRETFTLTESATPAGTGTAVAQLGASCNGVPGVQTVNCSVAHFGTSGGVLFADSFTTTATAGTGGANATAAVTASLFLSTSFTLVQSLSTWTIGNATAFNTESGTYNFASTGPTGNGVLTLTDVLYTYTETATLTSSGLAVSIIENPNSAVTAVTPIANATVDAAGTGLLTYADGTTEPIAAGLLGF